MPTVTHVWTCLCICSLFRPYRALTLLDLNTQGVALGCIIVALSGRHDRRAIGLWPIPRRRTFFLEGPPLGEGYDIQLYTAMRDSVPSFALA